MSKRDTINYLKWEKKGLVDALEMEKDGAEAMRKELADQRKEIHQLKAGVETRYEVITVTRTGSRDMRGFSQKVDALHDAADKRIGDAFERVTINEIESRRRALYPDGSVIQPFGN